MSFTALHRAVGVDPGPLTEDLLNAAVAGGVKETSDLDWKSELPPSKGLPQSDVPKDVAAMANSGGGLIIYGVREVEKAATERVDAGDFGEGHERSFRSAAITAISPPVFGLNIFRLGTEGDRAVIVEVPASIDGPHLVYRGEYFGAPTRNHADTVWMRERQIEAMYRARFDQTRHVTEALDSLYREAAAGRDAHERAWLVAIAYPRFPRFRGRLTRDEAREGLTEARQLALTYASNGGTHPLESVDWLNPRPGLRRWVAVNSANDSLRWKESWITLHHDGSVTVAASVGGHRSRTGQLDGCQIEASAIECAIADFMAVIRATAEMTSNDEYDVRVGIEWTGEQPLLILTRDNFGYPFSGVSTPIVRYTPVAMSVNARAPDLDFHGHVYDLARDCLNQGGISNLHAIQPLTDAEEAT